MTDASLLAQALQPLQGDLAAVEHLLFQCVAPLGEPMQRMLCHVLKGGKRVRPALVLLVGRLFELRDVQCFHRLAAAVELLHTATLIHDDIVDDAPYRRGRATLHTLYSPEQAVLAGDCLLALAVEQAALLRDADVMRVLAQALCSMSQGELHQAQAHYHITTEAEYYRAIEAKTASLCAAATEMAALLAGAPQETAQRLRRYGSEIGLAFQIVDDVLDLTSNEQELGKRPGTDLAQRIVTLPILYYLRQAPPCNPIRDVLDGQDTPEAIQGAIAAILDSNAVVAALEKACIHARHACTALAGFPPGVAHSSLQAIAAYVTSRHR